MNLPKNPNDPRYNTDDIINRTQPQTLGQSIGETMFDAGNAARHWYANMQTGMLQQAPGLAAALGYKDVMNNPLVMPSNQTPQVVQAPSQMIMPRMR